MVRMSNLIRGRLRIEEKGRGAPARPPPRPRWWNPRSCRPLPRAPRWLRRWSPRSPPPRSLRSKRGPKGVRPRGRPVRSLARGRGPCTTRRFGRANAPQPAGDFLVAHAVSVAILSLKIGLGLEFERDRLHGLGLAAFLFDAGMWRLPEAIVRQADHLTPDEEGG